MRWINVKEELPPVQEPVLICCSGEVSMAWLMDETFGNGTHWEDAYTDHLQGITHWMKRPEPPVAE